jgi:hypothetical protein
MGGLITGGQADRRTGGRKLPHAVPVAVVILLSASPPDRLSAQVGHDPGHSPYKDVRPGGTLVVSGGYFGGSRGGPGVGISNGPTGGLRYEVPFGGALGASLGVAYAQTTRFVVDYTKDSLTRKTGPFNTDVILVDAGLQLTLSGRKTWHGLAPYVGGALGLAIGGGSPPDPSNYDFGSKFTVAPGAGIRWYPARRVSVRTDFRVVLWRLKYPSEYKVGGVLPPDARLTEWTAHPWISVGLGWTF